MPAYAYLILIVGTVVWFAPFVPAHQKTGPAKVVNRRSRWGVLLQFAAFTLLWQGHFWERSLPAWRALLSIALFTVAAAPWTSSRALGIQFRRLMPASAPITSWCALDPTGWFATQSTLHAVWICAVAVIVTPWPFLLSSKFTVHRLGLRFAFVLRGLLAAQFGDEFADWARRTRYIRFSRSSECRNRPWDSRSLRTI
jgi:hypothetical protein